VNSNQSQFCLIQSRAQGIYAGMHDPEQHYFLQFTFEQHPGVLDWDYADVPRGDELAGRRCIWSFAPATSSLLTHIQPRICLPSCSVRTRATGTRDSTSTSSGGQHGSHRQSCPSGPKIFIRGFNSRLTVRSRTTRFPTTSSPNTATSARNTASAQS